MEKQLNVPKLRFPEFKGEWEKKKLGEIFSISAGGDIEIEHVSLTKNDKYKYPIYANAEKGKGFYGWSDIYKVEENVLTVAGRGVNIGIAHARDHKFYPIVRLLVLKPNKKENVKFFEYQVNRLNLFKESTGVPQLTVPQVSGYEVVIPSLPEQSRIASFFSAIDEKLKLETQRIAALKQYKKGVMQKLFSQELRFKDENGKEFPDWEVKKLGEVFYSEKGKGISKNKLIENGQYECVLYGELYTKYAEVIFEVVSKTNEIDGLKSKIGDLLIPSSTTTTGIDLANITALNKNEVLLGGDITILRSNELINNIFYAYYLSNHKKEEIASYAQGSTIVHLYYSHIKDMIIDLPCFKEQTKIANVLTSIDKKIDLFETKIQRMQEYKKGLLQQMFV